MAIEKPLFESAAFPRIILIGGGFGRIELAKHSKDKEVEIIKLNRHNYPCN